MCSSLADGWSCSNSLQRGEEPADDGLLERFRRTITRPYYRSYVDEDFPAIVNAENPLRGSSGLHHCYTWI